MLKVCPLVIVLFIFMQVAFAQDCTNPIQDDLNRIATLARDWDYMHDAMLAQVGPNDVRTRFGTVIDQSCFHSLSPEARSARILKTEQGISHAIEQMHLCGAAIRFTEVPDVIATIRRTRIMCSDLGPSGLGMMSIEFRQNDTALRMTATANHRFEMTLSTPVIKNGETTDGSNFENLSINDLGSVIAHEAMHVLAMNNRSWHNELSSRAKFGCDNTVYYDRVYFTEATCFPNSRSGPQFYSDGGPYQCPGVCEAALTEVDQEVIDESTPAASLHDTFGVFGPPTVARPYPVAEAARICERIRSLRGVFPPAP